MAWPIHAFLHVSDLASLNRLRNMKHKMNHSVTLDHRETEHQRNKINNYQKKSLDSATLALIRQCRSTL